jgi:hypothetical protein
LILCVPILETCLEFGERTHAFSIADSVVMIFIAW